MKKIAKLGFAIALLGFTTPVAFGIPILQIYAEGATYDSTTESWVINGWSFAEMGPIKIWTIGNVAGPGGTGPISNVHMSIAYDSGFTPTIVLTPSTATPTFGFVDPSIPLGTGTLIQTVTDGSVPLLSDGTPLPSHGEYGPGVSWQEFNLGNFTLTDSPVADFIGSFPSTLYPNSGQINVYELTVTEGISFENQIDLHIDLYDSIQAGNKGTAKSVFAPFSHDGQADSLSPVPEPSTVLLTGSGIVAILGATRFRRKKKQAK